MNEFYKLYAFYELYGYSEGVKLTLKLVGLRPTDRPTDQLTDIVLYRAAITAKNIIYRHSESLPYLT